MREIKFRAWDIEEKRMFHHFDLPDQYLIGLDATVWDTKKPDKFGLGLGDVVKDKFVLQQFTGLKDKNGKEIYEGDILRFSPESDWEIKNYSAYEVFFHDGDANNAYNIGYSLDRCHNHGAIAGGILPAFKPNGVRRMEVIGNIYENPELLKQ